MCASLFTWASTYDSEAEEVSKDKHNWCLLGWGLVYDPCSKNRMWIYDTGIHIPFQEVYNYDNGAVEKYQHKALKKMREGITKG